MHSAFKLNMHSRVSARQSEPTCWSQGSDIMNDYVQCTELNVTLGKLPRDGMEWVWAFLGAQIPSCTELSLSIAFITCASRGIVIRMYYFAQSSMRYEGNQRHSVVAYVPSSIFVDSWPWRIFNNGEYMYTTCTSAMVEVGNWAQECVNQSRWLLRETDTVSCHYIVWLVVPVRKGFSSFLTLQKYNLQQFFLACPDCSWAWHEGGLCASSIPLVYLKATSFRVLCLIDASWTAIEHL